jgi:hypothetical protein
LKVYAPELTFELKVFVLHNFLDWATELAPLQLMLDLATTQELLVIS